jgi:hypothetical protein
MELLLTEPEDPTMQIARAMLPRPRTPFLNLPTSELADDKLPLLWDWYHPRHQEQARLTGVEQP